MDPRRPPSTPAPRRPPHERVAARVVTGPLGHAWGGVVDVLVLLARVGWARARRRERGSLL